MIQSYSAPSAVAAFPTCLTWELLQWRPAGCWRPRELQRLLMPVSSGVRSGPLLLLHDQLELQGLSSSVSLSLQPGRPSEGPDAILHLHNRLVNCRSFQNNRMYYLIRVPEKVFFAFIFFHLVLIVSFFVYVLNYYASTNPAAFGMLKNWRKNYWKLNLKTPLLRLTRGGWHITRCDKKYRWHVFLQLFTFVLSAF